MSPVGLGPDKSCAGDVQQGGGGGTENYTPDFS
jgi:hypothetical protein